MILSVFTDGGSRGNPGISGYGLVIKSADKVIFEEAKFLGIKTNNEAEYMGLIGALTWISENKKNVEKICIYSDSQLVVRQVQGIYKMKAPHLKPLLASVHSLISEINLPIEFQSVPREQNSLADELANQAMDQKR